MAARIITAVSRDKHSLTAELGRSLPLLEDKQRSLCQQLSYGVIRHYSTLDYLSQQLLSKPLKAKDQDLKNLLLCGLFELMHMRTPPHAVLSETVNASKKLGKQWASGMINACLRAYQRRADSLNQDLACDNEASSAHPAWLLEQLSHDWPSRCSDIIEANNQAAPMMLRVNRQKCSRDDYLNKLVQADIPAQALNSCPDGILLDQAVDVYQLPGFEAGEVSVQDGAAQHVVRLMQLEPGLRILDACAAPGGKSCHMLEHKADIQLLAMDLDASRLKQISENASRLNLEISLLCADASQPESWWDGQLFDRILLDAPCSGTGVIRRHPDIKLLRRPEDIAQLALRQQQLLDALWPLVRAGGMMIYTTCSVMKQENEQQIEAFLQRHHDATELQIADAPAHRTHVGYQRLPGDDVMDGFYYACLQRS
ncbi:16S rRNA methyltransferase B [Methylophaga lonarensis MPL]|uniref:16S rRNA (cytosine(967)-C(5))-methyltransferase n=1 Tax=Methylophaga lonarensis MPL TaxID=1286106 RepID=M7P3X8_9GAMM|nr:16S rRNA (cytosine(967)-C(5))-methyltransferase RsmB [Methylophaga lonarensis]EMR14217.1 16S rRNA methyltransferase B [Methylophaga lonarensis MPL]